MKQISTGAGLLGLGVCVVAGAAFAIHRGGSEAFAQESAKSYPPPIATDSVRARQTAALQAGECEQQVWFDPNPHEFLSGCGSLACLPLSPADVNRDGTAELFSAPAAVQIAGGNPIVPYPISGLLQWSHLRLSTLGPAAENASVFDFDAGLGTEFIARLPDRGGDGNCTHSWDIQCTARGWLDCDGDGDLDLVVAVTTYRTDCSWGGQPWACRCYRGVHSSTNLWFENVGFQTSRYGDLDQNGVVDNADIAMLLLNFD